MKRYICIFIALAIIFTFIIAFLFGSSPSPFLGIEIALVTTALIVIKFR